MQLFKHIKTTVLLLFISYFIHIAFFIIYITKVNSIGRAGLHTGCFYVSYNGWVLVLFCIQFAILQALYAERTFFNNTTAANCYIRIQYHSGKIVIHLEHYFIHIYITQWFLIVSETVSSVIVKPVKAAHFVRAVISTISCTDTTVINHLIKAFAAVVCSSHRANVFARRIITMLAKHRLKHHIRIL